MGTELTLAATLVGSCGILVAGIAWLVRRLMKLGEWLGAVGQNTDALKKLTERFDTLSGVLLHRVDVIEGNVQSNARRIAELERELQRSRDDRR